MLLENFGKTSGSMHQKEIRKMQVFMQFEVNCQPIFI
jgi:hypothetical protein